jgi:hypothetical protein
MAVKDKARREAATVNLNCILNLDLSGGTTINRFPARSKQVFCKEPTTNTYGGWNA